MEHQLIIEAEVDIPREVKRSSGILRIGNIEESVLVLFVLVEIQGMRKQVQQVARRFHISLDSPAVVVVRVAKARSHNKEVLVVVAQNGVARCGIVQILTLEGRTDPRHVDIVQIQQVHLVAVVVSLVVPLIPPPHREHTAMELRTVLQVVVSSQLRGGIDTTTETTGEERCDESWEGQTRTNTIFYKVAVAIFFQSPDGLIGSTQVDREGLRTTKEVTVLEGDGDGSAKVTRGVCAFWLEGDG